MPGLVILSGGLDSTVCMAIAARDTGGVLALTFDYGQRHRAEIDRAALVAAHYGAEHLVVELDASRWGGSALTDPTIDVPEALPGAAADAIPVTYVPARNTIFLSFALAWAETLGTTDIVIGVNALDYSGYPDCRPEYIAAFQHLANLATRAGTELNQRFNIQTPLILLSKQEIIARGIALGVDYGLTLSCYDPSPTGEACGRCDACQLRLKGFRENGLEDPAMYQKEKSVNSEQ